MNWVLIDAGNSALKWALAGSDEHPPPAVHALEIDSDDLATRLAAALSAALPAAGAGARQAAGPAGAFGCSVASAAVMEAVASAVDAAVAPAPGLLWLRAQPGFEHGGIRLQNGYRDPAQLGADRWHAMIAARARFPDEPLVVVAAGTATTIDAVTRDGRFVGGVIAPGIRLMLGSLARGTARLPLAAGRHAPRPDNTDDAIATGVLEAQLGAIERRARRHADDCGSAVRLVLSGGHAPALVPYLAAGGPIAAVAPEPDLVLRGLWHRVRAEHGPVAGARALARLDDPLR